MPSDAKLLDRFPQLRKTLLGALAFAANEYANGGLRAKPGVDAHFTPGNDKRYNWPPLSAEYAKRKAAGTVNTRKGFGAFLDRDERRLPGHQQRELARLRGTSRLGEQPVFQRASAEARASGLAGSEGTQGGLLPMLVLSGDLRAAVDSRAHTIRVSDNGTATITFRNLPGYAVYHHTGAGNLPRRSPVEPNAQDRAAVVEAMKRFLKRNLSGGGGAKQQSVGVS